MIGNTEVDTNNEVLKPIDTSGLGLPERVSFFEISAQDFVDQVSKNSEKFGEMVGNITIAATSRGGVLGEGLQAENKRVDKEVFKFSEKHPEARQVDDVAWGIESSRNFNDGRITLGVDLKPTDTIIILDPNHSLKDGGEFVKIVDAFRNLGSEIENDENLSKEKAKELKNKMQNIDLFVLVVPEDGTSLFKKLKKLGYFEPIQDHSHDEAEG